MILFLTRKVSGSSDALMQIFAERGISAFRLNFDLFRFYQFIWRDNEFEIEDQEGRICHSPDVDIIIFYKGLFAIDEAADYDHFYPTEAKWVKSWLNNLYYCFSRYAAERDLIRLWHPFGFTCTKPWQMVEAKSFFSVPEFTLHWGFHLQQREVIAKSLTARPYNDRDCLYAKKVDREKLDPGYPWFTQEIADGDRDATVLYINGRVHCFQFASPRGDMTDWRVSQGTESNRWERWNAGREFENRVDAYMKKLGLKFGRLDFIIGGREPQFLEVNPCGQFGWLDDDALSLHNEVADAILSPSARIGL